MKRCFREQASDGNLDIVGAKCLIFRLTGKSIKRREIVDLVQDDEITLSEFERIISTLRERHYITDSGTLLNNLYGALDEGRKGYVDEARLARTMIRAGCPILATTRAHDAFARLDELQIGKTSITQAHTILENGASVMCHQAHSKP